MVVQLIDVAQGRRIAAVRLLIPEILINTGEMIKTETYDWIERQLNEADADGMSVLPVAHHNLLDESKVYADNCTIEHSEYLIDLLEARNIPLFLSGHLHVRIICSTMISESMRL